MRVIWSRLAREDLFQIAEYIAEDNPRAAVRISRMILASAKMLGASPEVGRAGRVAGTRELVVSGTPYVAVYRIHKRRVEVIAVRHGARDWPKEF